MRPVVYLAGPYTHPDPVTNTRAALAEATVLLDSGLVVPIVPHLSLFWDFQHPRPYETWLEMDLEVIRRCDAVLRLAGVSSGADREVEFARGERIPVFFAPEEMREFARWADSWSTERGA